MSMRTSFIVTAAFVAAVPLAVLQAAAQDKPTSACKARDVAHELQIPLIDYHGEILRRRPKDWDGAADSFKKYEGQDWTP